MKDWETDKHRWPVSSWNSEVLQLSMVERTESTVGITEVKETALLQLPVPTASQCTALLHTPGVNRENRSMLLSRPCNPSYLPPALSLSLVTFGRGGSLDEANRRLVSRLGGTLVFQVCDGGQNLKL